MLLQCIILRGYFIFGSYPFCGSSVRFVSAIYIHFYIPFLLTIFFEWWNFSLLLEAFLTTFSKFLKPSIKSSCHMVISSKTVSLISATDKALLEKMHLYYQTDKENKKIEKVDKRVSSNRIKKFTKWSPVFLFLHVKKIYFLRLFQKLVCLLRKNRIPIN